MTITCIGECGRYTKASERAHCRYADRIDPIISDRAKSHSLSPRKVAEEPPIAADYRGLGDTPCVGSTL